MNALPRREWPLLHDGADYTPPPKVPNYQNETARLARDEGYDAGHKTGFREGAAVFFSAGAAAAAAVVIIVSHLLAGLHS